MTLPIVQQAYNIHITEVRLKKFYSDMNNAVRLASIDYDDPTYWSDYTELYNSRDAEKIDDAFQKYFGPYLKITRKDFYKNTYVYVFSDGSAVSFLSCCGTRHFDFYPKNYRKCLDRGDSAKSMCSFRFTFFNDQNDEIAKQSSLWKYHNSGKTIEPNLYNWDGNIQTLYDDKTRGCSIASGGNGSYCAALIKFNNWKVPKDVDRRILY